MAFVYGERLIEYAIRVAAYDIMQDPAVAQELFYADPLVKLGADMTPPGGPEFREKLVTDIFQEKLAQIQRIGSEIGKETIFSNSIPSIPDMIEYLARANVRIVHGMPRETTDLPCIAITLGSEGEQQYLGTQKDHLVSTDGTREYLLIGSDAKAMYQIHIISTNHDETILWHYLVKYALLKWRPAIEAYGLREQSMDWMDVEPAAEYLQAGVFVYQRTCILSAMKDESFLVRKEGFNTLVYSLMANDQAVGGGQIVP